MTNLGWSSVIICPSKNPCEHVLPAACVGEFPLRLPCRFLDHLCKAKPDCDPPSPGKIALYLMTSRAGAVVARLGSPRFLSKGLLRHF